MNARKKRHSTKPLSKRSSARQRGTKEASQREKNQLKAIRNEHVLRRAFLEFVCSMHTNILHVYGKQSHTSRYAVIKEPYSVDIHCTVTYYPTHSLTLFFLLFCHRTADRLNCNAFHPFCSVLFRVVNAVSIGLSKRNLCSRVTHLHT